MKLVIPTDLIPSGTVMTLSQLRSLLANGGRVVITTQLVFPLGNSLPKRSFRVLKTQSGAVAVLDMVVEPGSSRIAIDTVRDFVMQRFCEYVGSNYCAAGTVVCAGSVV